MISFTHKGDFKQTSDFLNRGKRDFSKSMHSYAEAGVNALEAATPKDSGITANSWGYEIRKRRSGFSIFWTNDHIVDGVPIVILIQYGHGTRSGGFIQGKDFINPVMRPIFEKIVATLWKEVDSL